MKILLVGGSSRALGGVERYCERFAEAFRPVPGVVVESASADTAVAGAPLPAYARGLAGSFAAVGRAAARLDTRTDAVWLQYGNAPDLALLAWLRARFRGRLLVTAHAGEQWRHLRSPGPRRAAAWALRRADRVCALSEAQRTMWAGMGIAAEVVPTLLPAWINEPVDTAAERSGILFVGRLSPEKGIPDLLEAFSALPGDELLHVAGAAEPAYLQFLRDQAAGLGVRDRVRWYGPLGERQVLVLMRACRVLAYPSYADAYPLSLLEGVAAGMRVVAYGIPGTLEILRESGGAAVPLGDRAALAAVLAREAAAPPADPSHALRLRERLGWDAVVRTYLAIARA
ncbi:glycosyltransferase [Longimicrobium terrae]|uniref:Glycosyltransferase involved in cell wall biosynthesis n=1 Tax=Longimicrobium terrae TaxID=1639882 RepID=A0A841GU80_9BACT|nr:glycosyltransferase involved in cell wall biosynthesis [Longimicrobium terrae]MBB6068574.1 glycosyltransferase involved in cell wall biosynthesis [Longimicrobium terrae]NNC27761.1 glycosyltransferase family 4 protein [Longimicrobium terrae]